MTSGQPHGVKTKAPNVGQAPSQCPATVVQTPSAEPSGRASSALD